MFNWSKILQNVIFFSIHNCNNNDKNIIVVDLPVIKPFNFEDNVKEGDIVSVMCLTIGGTQPIVFSWKKDDKELSSSQSIPQVNIENSPVVSVLILNGVTVNSDGNYTCTARNSYGSSTYSSALKVKGKLFSKEK